MANVKVKSKDKKSKVQFSGNVLQGLIPVFFFYFPTDGDDDGADLCLDRVV